MVEETIDQLRRTIETLLAAFTEASKIVDQLKDANTASTILEDWHEDMLHHLVAEVGLNLVRMVQLLNSLTNNNGAILALPTLAYVVRSQLELTVWIHYCCKSRDNAKRFHEDSYRDGLGLQKAMKRLVSLVPGVSNHGDLQAALSHFEATLQQAALSAGMSSLDEDYTRVVQAADELGWKAAFVGFNTLLSKFAHPTAMVVLNYAPDAYGGMSALFLVAGVFLISDACETIKKFIRSLGIAL
jgi:hypothetical protein